MQCLYCQKNIHNNPWNHLTNLDKETNKDKYICSYVCYKRLSENNKLPKNLWSHIVNKIDYIDIINPILPKESEFQYLTHDEISEMNDKQKIIYFQRKEEQIEYDSSLTQIRDELEKEDERISKLENIYSDSDDLNDDY
jgi:hypothetical protein